MKGFLNLGNTCYFNSCLQCLFQTPSISNQFLLKPYKGTCEFTTEYSRLLKLFWFEKTTPVLDPTKLLGIFRNKFKQFNNNREHDAQEAMLGVIDILEKARPSLKNVIYGTLQKKIIYPGGSSVTNEKFSILMLTPTRNSSLEELLRDHMKHEVLEGYTDNSEKTHHVAVLEQSISKYPPILAIGFNMFNRKFKIKIPEKFKNYRLYASCVHMGSTRGGHYIAYTKHRNIWYLKDDDNVRKDVKHPMEAPFYLCLFKLVNSSN